MEIEAVQVHKVRRPRAQDGPKTLREIAAVVFVIGVNTTTEDAARVVPDLPHCRMLIGNRRRLGDETSDVSQRLLRRSERVVIAVVVDAKEGYEINVVCLLQLLQDVERADGHSRVGRVRETLGEEQQAWSSGHRGRVS